MWKIATRNGWKWNVERIRGYINDLDILKMNTPLNITVINSESDFPVQDESTITLTSGRYLIGGVITTSKRFIIQDGVDISAGSTASLTLTYTGTGDMFTSVNSNWSLTDITYSCPNGRVFNCSGTGIWLNERTSCVDVKDIGVFTGVGFSNINFTNFNFLNCTGQGLQLFGTFFVTHLTKMYINSTSSSFIGIDIGTSISSDLEFRDIEMYGVSGGIALKGATSSANVVVGSLATVKDCTLSGGYITPLSGITPTDIRWDFSGNAVVEDTIEDALIYFNSNTTPTVITSASSDGTNAVNINAVWLMGRLSKFSATSEGLITYLGERPITVPVDVTVNVTGTTGSTQEVNTYLYKNGVVIPATKRGDEVTNTRGKQLFTPWQMTFHQGDTLRVKIENESSTNNLICTQGVLRVR
jgi:hypothetical protein